MDRVRTWIKFRLLEPRFDNPNARMPKLGLTEQQAVKMAEMLTGTPGAEPTLVERVAALIPEPSKKLVLAVFAGGGVLALAGSAILRRLRRLRRRR